MNIKTKYQTNAKGVGQIVAKGGGKQRTIGYDHYLTPAANHGRAAGVLGKVFGLNPRTRTIITLNMDHGNAEFQVG
jgi:hypothetical protein